LELRLASPLDIGRLLIELYYQIRNWLEGTYTLRILEDFFQLWWKILPYVIISIGLNVAGARFVRHKTLPRPASNEYLSIIIAALIGLASPLPTYAAVPIGISLMATGLPFSAVMAFILASPLMNPTIFFLTATQISISMAIARTVSAFLLAVTGGLLTAKVFTRLYHGQPDNNPLRSPAERTLAYDVAANSKYILKYFSIALVLSSAVRALIPPETIAELLGGNGRVSTLVAIGMGVPFYTCGGSAIPFMETLMNLGMQKGPMLAFFIAGPATKLETLYAYRSQLGMKVLAFYLALTLVFSYVAGVLYSSF
jgi:uncharacterized protein